MAHLTKSDDIKGVEFAGVSRVGVGYIGAITPDFAKPTVMMLSIGGVPTVLTIAIESTQTALALNL
jgi:hypothetical protein